MEVEIIFLCFKESQMALANIPRCKFLPVYGKHVAALTKV